MGAGLGPGVWKSWNLEHLGGATEGVLGSGVWFYNWFPGAEKEHIAVGSIPSRSYIRGKFPIAWSVRLHDSDRLFLSFDLLTL